MNANILSRVWQNVQKASKRKDIQKHFISEFLCITYSTVCYYKIQYIIWIYYIFLYKCTFHTAINFYISLNTNYFYEHDNIKKFHKE